jgi:hypothetical protein
MIMATDYSKGYYIVRDMRGMTLGRIEKDDFIRNGKVRRFRLDGGEVYRMSGDGRLIGFVQADGTVKTPRGRPLFRIESR